jgi:hypothetical protein
MSFQKAHQKRARVSGDAEIRLANEMYAIALKYKFEFISIP